MLDTIIALAILGTLTVTDQEGNERMLTKPFETREACVAEGTAILRNFAALRPDLKVTLKCELDPTKTRGA